MRSDSTVINDMNIISFNINNCFKDTYNFAEYNTVKFLSKGIVERYLLKRGITIDQIDIRINDKFIKLINHSCLLEYELVGGKIVNTKTIKKNCKNSLEVSRLIDIFLEEECCNAEDNKIKVDIHIEMTYKK